MRIFGLIALLLFMGLQVQAQGRRGQGQKMTPEQRVEAQAKKLTAELQLDNKQQEQVRAALQERVRAADELRAQTAADRQERINKARAIQQNFNTSMRGILNAEQQAKFEQFQAKRKEQMKDRMHKRGGKHGGKGRKQGGAADEDMDDLEDFR
jgi:hypothetical protein